MNTYPRRLRGFTLYELLMTMLVIGVVLVIGVPNMTAFTANNRITATANDLHAAFQLARSEAARSKSNVVICASNNALDNNATCGGTWADGFIVFQSTTPPGPDPDLARDPANEPLLRASPAIATGVNLRVTGNASYFMYAPTGMGREIPGETAVSQIFVCDERGNTLGTGGSSAARLFVATPVGRATVVRDMATIGEALNGPPAVTCP